jgi:hypothetical protein
MPDRHVTIHRSPVHSLRLVTGGLRAASRQAASTFDAIGRLLNPEAARMNLSAWVV